MTRQARALATREVVLRAAARVIDRLGYDAATIAQILTEAGVTKGALYFHFESKEALAVAIMREQERWLVDHGTLDGPPIQQLVDTSFAFGTGLREDVLLRASIRMTTERGVLHGTAASMYPPWIESIHRALTEAKRHGHLVPRADPARLAFVVASAITGLQLTSDATSGRADIEQRLSDLWTVLLPGVVGPERVALVDVRAPQARRRRLPGSGI